MATLLARIEAVENKLSGIALPLSAREEGELAALWKREEAREPLTDAELERFFALQKVKYNGKVYRGVNMIEAVKHPRPKEQAV